mmetsp:Transcript_7467/g.16562  ORF Transcript_7467/g.16562 Transcript_7467/m.16562 type:complete len:84 (+) Transcript_7467:1742-1993(+)
MVGTRSCTPSLVVLKWILYTFLRFHVSSVGWVEVEGVTNIVHPSSDKGVESNVRDLVATNLWCQEPDVSDDASSRFERIQKCS